MRSHTEQKNHDFKSGKKEIRYEYCFYFFSLFFFTVRSNIFLLFTPSVLISFPFTFHVCSSASVMSSTYGYTSTPNFHFQSTTVFVLVFCLLSMTTVKLVSNCNCSFIKKTNCSILVVRFQLCGHIWPSKLILRTVATKEKI